MGLDETYFTRERKACDMEELIEQYQAEMRGGEYPASVHWTLGTIVGALEVAREMEMPDNLRDILDRMYAHYVAYTRHELQQNT
jgi:hypothetical protein